MRRLTGPRELLSVDLRGLAAFRAAIGVLVMLDTLMRWVDLRAHYTDFGILPVGPYVDQFSNDLHVSLHLANGMAFWQHFLFSLTLLAGLALAVGYRTRLATVATWVLLVSLHNRNPMLLNGGDVLLRCLLFWGIFLPLGARWSVDDALAEGPRPPGNAWFGGASIGLLSQIVWVYLATALLKDGTEWWPDGTASYYALSLDEFTTRFGVWMRQWHEALRFGSYAVFALEWSVVFVVLCPFYTAAVRSLSVACLLIMHVNFDLAMRLGLFPWVDIATLLVLLPTEVYDALAARVAKPARRGLRIYYDRDCAFCRKVVLLLREALLLGDAKALPAQDDPEMAAVLAAERSWVVVDHAGARHLRWDALVTVVEHAPVLGAALRRLPLRALAPLGDRAYRWVATHRPQLGELTARVLPYGRRAGGPQSMLGTFVCLFFVGYVGLWNLKTIPRFGVEILEPWVKIGQVLRLDQKWNMFAPYPMREGGWYVIPGELADGTKVDVWTGREGTPTEAKPELVSDTFPNARWRKYMMNIYEKKNKEYRLYFGKWLCRSWNEGREAPRKLMKFEIVFMNVETPPPGAPGKPERLSLWQHECLKKKDD